MATVTMASTSSWVSTRPVGLLGELTMMALVRGVTFSRSKSAVTRKLSSLGRLTGTGMPPARVIIGG